MKVRDCLTRLVCWSLFLSFFLLLASCSTPVQVVGGLQQDEANVVFSVLLNADIKADKSVDKDGLVTIFVESDQVAKAIDLLRSRGLPKYNFQGFGDVFKKESMVSSPVEERARYLHALSEELSRTLSNIDGVMVARVHLVLPEHDSFTDQAIPSSAAIFIKYRKSYNIDILQPQIKRLVANSIPGLETDRVSIVLVPGEEYGTPPSTTLEMSADGVPKTLLFISLLMVVASLAGVGFGAYLYWQRHKNSR